MIGQTIEGWFCYTFVRIVKFWFIFALFGKVTVISEIGWGIVRKAAVEHGSVIFMLKLATIL